MMLKLRAKKVLSCSLRLAPVCGTPRYSSQAEKSFSGMKREGGGGGQHKNQSRSPTTRPLRGLTSVSHAQHRANAHGRCSGLPERAARPPLPAANSGLPAPTASPFPLPPGPAPRGHKGKAAGREKWAAPSRWDCCRALRASEVAGGGTRTHTQTSPRK